MASPALHEAIHRAHLERLQSVLLTLCKASPIAQQVLERELLMDEEPASGDEADKQNVLNVTALTAKKTQRSRYVTCKHCHQEFDLAANTEKSCKTHDGPLEPIEDEWIDHDERCHGPIESEENYESFPEGFLWECCERPADAEGCCTDIHYEDADFKPTTKKRKLWPSCE
ncbi:uncharacterized protein BKCO1_2700069 [Diplodia corticola]|uniref:C2H2-type domain-containing protein n=1 Tax=Diplodia corticola TaxID=236234 RepID=A0A1J9S2A2_9PEZI|nr:uncharacterized protein BKCO1_2700069 [Diplodia corticola]OJD33773.1 hypothetical protein BKCO1_2700069 [Diplodia corticola]